MGILLNDSDVQVDKILKKWKLEAVNTGKTVLLPNSKLTALIEQIDLIKGKQKSDSRKKLKSE